LARPVILCSEPWTDLPLAELAHKAAAWGYQGLELSAAGDHLEVQRAASEDDYCSQKLELLAQCQLAVPVVNGQRVGQAVADPIDQRHQALLPDYVWGDGKPLGVQQRAAEEMMATCRIAQKLGATVVSGCGGSPLWSFVAGYPTATAEQVRDGLAAFAELWNPILDVCRETGVKFALLVQPGQIAFDLYSAEQVLEALEGREEFGFTFDPAALHWQGVDPVEFLRRFGPRIYHVHMCDVALMLNGRSSLLGSNLPAGDPRRGWERRAPGHGGLDWEGLIRALNQVGYDGPLSVAWHDAGMARDVGAEEACKFVKRLDFEPAQTNGERFF
jgi:sugar phosphate isomerase/epimerase